MKGIEQFVQVDAATLGALKYAGTWNASTNTPTLASGVGVQGQYYVVSVAGTTNLDGETNWQVGDWAVFNGSVWQKVDGGSTSLLTTLTVTGNTYLATTSGNVGIGTSSPAANLDIVGSGGTIARLKGGSGTNQGAAFYIQQAGSANTLFAIGDSAAILGGTPDAAVNIYTANPVPLTMAVGGTEKVRITSAGDVGIGTSSPANKLHVVGVGDVAQFTNGTRSAYLALDSGGYSLFTGAGQTGNGVYANATSNFVQLFTNGTAKATLDSAGNLGLGVTPSAWNANFRAYQAGSAGYAAFVGDQSNGHAEVLNNCYASGASTYTYSQSLGATRYSQQLGIHAWYTAGAGTAGNAISFTQAMTLDSAGNLGLGVTPSAWSANSGIDFGGLASVGNWQLSSNGVFLGSNFYYGSGSYRYKATSSAAMYVAGSGQHVWYTAPSGTADNAISFTQAMTLDASGNLKVGTTTGAARIISAVADGTYSFGAVGTTKAIRISHSSTASKIEGVDSTLSASYQPLVLNGSYLSFETSGAERARIDASGNLLVGTTDNSVTAGAGTKISTGANPRLAIVTDSSTSNTAISLYSTGAAAYRFFVDPDGTVYATNTTISAISDQRFKENVRDLDVGLNAIMALKPRKFDWKAGKGKDIKDDRGFIAQELEQVFPDLVDKWKDPAPEGEEPYKSVRQDLIPVLVKAIQELNAKVQALEAQLGA